MQLLVTFHADSDDADPADIARAFRDWLDDAPGLSMEDLGAVDDTFDGFAVEVHESDRPGALHVDLTVTPEGGRQVRLSGFVVTDGPTTFVAPDSAKPPVLLLLDLWLAMGGDEPEFHAWWAADPSFPDRWAQLVAAVAGNIDALEADSNPPAGALIPLAVQFPTHLVRKIRGHGS